MSPAGLYRYVASREDLLTWLIADADDDLADHMFVAVGAPTTELSDSDRPGPRVAVVADASEDVADRVRAVAAAYRQWSIDHSPRLAVPGRQRPALRRRRGGDPA